MARDINEIYGSMISAKEEKAELNALTSNSSAAVWRVILYIVAFGHYVLERIFDTHKTEVEDRIKQMKPHTLRWYVNKAKMFRAGQILIEGTDTYDDTGLTEEQIATMQVVKFAAASESNATVYIKVAGGTIADRKQITQDEYESLQAYINEIKDAGVRVEIVNRPATHLKLELRIDYNPMIINSKGEHFASGKKLVEEAVKEYIASLPFNGEYRNATLIDRLQAVDGVIIPTLVSAEESYNGVDYSAIGINSIPDAGYYKIYETSDLTIIYKPYESVSN